MNNWTPAVAQQIKYVETITQLMSWGKLMNWNETVRNCGEVGRGAFFTIANTPGARRQDQPVKV